MVVCIFKNREKLKAAAVASCERLGKYRMPLAWTAINLMNIFTGVHGDRENAPEREPSGSNSLGEYSSVALVVSWLKGPFFPVIFTMY